MTSPGRCGRLPLGATEECAGLHRAAAGTGTIHPAAVALQFLGLQLQALPICVSSCDGETFQWLVS